MRRDGLYKSSRHELLELTQPPEAMPWVKPSPRASYRACDTGPCMQGKKLCPSPEACRLSEQAERRATGTFRQVAWAGLILVGVAFWVAFIWWFRK